MMFRLFYNQNANLIQYPHRQGDERKREHVRCRGYNRGDHKDNHNSVFPIAAHKIRRQETQFGEQPRENRNLENNAHCKTHHYKR